MKIDLKGSDYKQKIFRTNEEWMAFIDHPCSTTPKKRYYDPQPRDLKPRQFPCLMVYDDDWIIYHSNGNDEYANFFFYNFEEEEIEDYGDIAA